MIKIADFNYSLPKNLIANRPADPRDSSRLMVLDRKSGIISHHVFREIPSFLKPGDVLVVNETKVFPARLKCTKRGGGETEVLLVKPQGNDTWECLGKNMKINNILDFSNDIWGKVTNKSMKDGTCTIQFASTSNSTLGELIESQGHTPIPPYIKSTLSENDLRQKYQTVYARLKGSVAAPTAGLHFTPELLGTLAERGITIEKITLHVGPGTFGTLYPHHLENKTLHEEKYTIEDDTVKRLLEAKKAGRRIIAVGTTSCRTLETVFSGNNQTLEVILSKAKGATTLFIMPPQEFYFVDALITNFHLPESSLLMLVTAFACEPNTSHRYENFANSLIGKAYASAVKEGYHFFSFGDAMFIS